MTLTVNGAARELADGSTLQQLLDAEVGSTRGSAAAVDGSVVPRAEWPSCVLRDGQSIEILTAVQGG
jgi:sulfur carrier protein